MHPWKYLSYPPRDYKSLLGNVYVTQKFVPPINTFVVLFRKTLTLWWKRMELSEPYSKSRVETESPRGTFF